jgi:hypothetical protein
MNRSDSRAAGVHFPSHYVSAPGLYRKDYKKGLASYATLTRLEPLRLLP